MDKSVERTQRTFIRILFGSFIGLILLVGICWGGHDLYVRWQERRLVGRAVTALAQNDVRNASLAARTILQLKPDSTGAARIMAQIGERLGDRAALEWRRKVVQVEPHSSEDLMALARCALQFSDAPTALRALEQIDAAGRETAGYHAVAALVAQAQGQNDKAESEWAQAVQLAPNDRSYQLQLGIVRLHAPDRERQSAGEAALRSLQQDPQQRAAAARALISEAVVRQRHPDELLTLGRELQSYPEATLNDRLLYLDLLHQLNDPAFTAYLTELERAAASQPVELATLLSWMSKNNLNLLAIDFLKTLPRDAVEKWPVPTAVADVCVRLKDWRKLEELTKNANWREFEFLRHAYLAHALRGQDKPAAEEHEWAAAVKGASARAESTMMLLRIVSDWKWDSEAVELLWALAKQPAKQSEAFLTLYRHYASNGDTQGLHKVLLRLFDSDPTNLDVQNNLAQVSLLLNANPDDARRLAADAYRKMPGNPAYATTYAYSLMTKGDIRGALNIMNGLTAEQLRDPATSVYYGICLAAAKDQKARGFLERAQKATLLPEERELVSKAQNLLN